MKQLNVELDWFANTNHTGFYTALKKGYFKDLGVDVHINGEYGGCGHQFAGTPDIVVAPQPAMLVYMDEAPEEEQATAIAVLTQKNDSGIISLASNGAKRPRELEGKRLTHWTPEWFHAVIGYMVDSDGGDYANVNLVQKDVGDIEETLGNDADAVWIYKSWEWFVMKHAGKASDYFALADFDEVMDFCAPAVAAKNRLIENDSDAVHAFVKAANQGFIDAAKDPEQGAAILNEYMPRFNREMLIDSQKYISDLYLDDSGNWGKIEPERWTRFSRFMADKGMIKTEYAAAEDRFTNQFHQSL